MNRSKKEKYKEDVDEANLPPHLAKFFDKKGNPKPEVAKRMSDAARKKKVVSKDVTPKGYGPNEDIDILHAEALQENGGRSRVEGKTTRLANVLCTGEKCRSSSYNAKKAD